MATLIQYFYYPVRGIGYFIKKQIFELLFYKTRTAFMDYLIAGIILILCIAAIVLALRVLQDSRKLGPQKKDEEED